MNNIFTFGDEDDALKTWINGDVAVLELKCNVYGTMVYQAESGRVLDLIHMAETDPQVKILLMTSSSDCFSSSKFTEFFDHIRPHKECDFSIKDSAEFRTQRLRYANVLKRIIMHLSGFRKISAVTLRGEIVTPFFGASMAADIRFVNPTFNYDPIHVRLGIHPGGGLPFFLPLHIGYARASEILLSGRGLNATEVLDLGLINEIIADEDFLDQVIGRLNDFSKYHFPATLFSTKMLLAHSRAGLEEYFDQESALIF